MDIAGYLDEVMAKYATGQATEHSYRAPLERLFESIDDRLTVINEPKRSDAGMPDFIFQRKDVPVGWVEAKDIDKDVIALKGYSKEQRQRYERAFPNLIYTNGVDFEFIRDGESVHFVSIADFVIGLQPKPENFDQLERQLRLFAEAQPISIRSAAKLAELMAAKAAIIKDEIGLALAEDPDFRTGLGGQFKSFRQNLLPNLTPGEFADIYAETITYGMFAARYHDDTPDDFSRLEAMERLPASNPFLKGLFEYIAGPSLPARLKYIVDDLVAVMRAAKPHDLFEDFGKFTARNDPFIHFYEDFLAAYNPKKRKSRGVWYTPEPVVDFIVRAVDDVLKSEFALADGLADTSKVTVDWDTGTNDPNTGKARTIKKDVHKVQILDPATGTGTFLAKAVQLISDRVKGRAPGMWSSYVENDLLPRLHGFELLMASYAMCHMKLDMQLTESGYTPGKNPPRLSVWLTNALEPAEREVRDLFFQPLAEEARGASEVKRQTPIMCVIGNPPYSVSSSNNSLYVRNSIALYKEGLNEQNMQPLSDDYIKFIRLGHRTIVENGEGILAFITNNSYIDGVLHRVMRKSLLRDFDKLFVLDLHGSAKKKEVTPEGEPDINVFDIMQGVAIVVAVKNSNSQDDAIIKHQSFWGRRSAKYGALAQATIKDSSFDILQPKVPLNYFVPKDFQHEELYLKGQQVNSLFSENLSGIKTGSDSKFVRFMPCEFGHLEGKGDRRLIREFDYRPLDRRSVYYDRAMIQRDRYNLACHLIDQPNLSLTFVRQLSIDSFSHVFCSDVMSDLNSVSINSKEQTYFSPLYLYPDDTADQSDAFAARERTLNLDPKLYAAICEAAGIDPADTDMARLTSPTPDPSRKREGSETSPQSGASRSGVGNGSTASFRAATGDARPSEVKVFDYIYGVLHSPDYRETFAEFLKIDFPRVPYPPSPEVFQHVSEKGEQLRRLHLMEPAAIGETPYPFLGEGDGEVAAKHPRFEPQGSGAPDQVRGDEEGKEPPPKSVRAEPVEARSFTSGAASEEKGSPSTSSGRTGKVYVNPGQYFDNVPQVAWDFYIGGYQPAQKWLKDRKGRTLSYEDVGHYQKIVKILLETDRIMQEIELPLDD